MSAGAEAVQASDRLLQPRIESDKQLDRRSVSERLTTFQASEFESRA